MPSSMGCRRAPTAELEATRGGHIRSAALVRAAQTAVSIPHACVRYWPEFATQGKERITLRQALTHTSCIPQVPAGVGPEDICDWDGMCRAIADLTPLWEPGTRSIYHAFTYGWILGEVARRVDGRP